MRAGKIGRLTVVVMCTLMLSGCDLQGTIEDLELELPKEVESLLGIEDWNPGETYLVVQEDGTLTETVIDRLDQNYYNAEELGQMITSTVGEYNQDHGADAVIVDSLSLENNQVILTMTYKTAGDYADYNNVRFYNGSMLGAELEGYLFYNEFRKVNDGVAESENITNEEPLKHKEYQVLVTDDSHLVQVTGDVVYVSANASPMGKREVQPVEEAEEVEQEGLVLPSSAVYVEEKEETPVTAKDLEKNYVYIIYEF